MCGFVGFFEGKECNENILTQMISTLHHRGPDDEGIWIDKNVGIGLAFARLSILELSKAGHQPMVSCNGFYVIVFNGEIYNHIEIRLELERENLAPRWKGRSDTETLLAGFEAWGISETIKKAIGMFAFGVWDRKESKLTLGRDRFGEKPLYYGWQGKTFLFGSELKALKEHPEFNAEIDRGALGSFMRFCYVPAPQSIYQGIYKLTPGTLLTIHSGEKVKATPIPYWSFLDQAKKGLRNPFLGSEAEAIIDLENILRNAVTSQLLSDVPLGAFLSGGIDSSIIVGLMQSQSMRPIQTFTIGFEDQLFNEAKYAKAVAKHIGTEHTEYYVTSKEARDVIPRISTIYDEPFSDSSQIPMILVSQLARSKVTVSLSGDAGDELFCGYNRYLIPEKVQKVPFIFRKLLANLLTSLSPSSWDMAYGMFSPLLPKSMQVSLPGEKAHKLSTILSSDSEEIMYNRLISTWFNPEELVLGGRQRYIEENNWNILLESSPPQLLMAAKDTLSYLVDDILCKVDRAAMATSLETRVPFLDHRVVDFAWSLPLNMKIRDGQGKWILRQLLAKYVPEKLTNRPKMGFSIPLDSWLRGPLKEWADNLINETRIREEGYLNSTQIKLKWKEHLSGKRNWQFQLWNVLVFQEWLAQQRNGN